MLTAAAVIGWVVVGAGYGAIAARTMNVGDTLTGVGQLFVGLAAATAAMASWLNGRKTKAKTEDVVAAVGPPNGRSIQQVLNQLEANQGEIKNTQAEIKAFEEYQHQRNHDVLGELTEIKLAVPLMIAATERLLDKLNQEA